MSSKNKVESQMGKRKATVSLLQIEDLKLSEFNQEKELSRQVGSKLGDGRGHKLRDRIEKDMCKKSFCILISFYP